MKRKIDTNRVYKLVRGIVVIVSAIAILIGVIWLITFNKNMEIFNGYLTRCLREGLTTCGYEFSLMSNYKNTIYCSFLIGSGLPIIFFGGKALINYIAPVVKKQNEKDKKTKKN